MYSTTFSKFKLETLPILTNLSTSSEGYILLLEVFAIATIDFSPPILNNISITPGSVTIIFLYSLTSILLP